MYRPLSFTLLVAAGAVAQSLPSLTTQCQQALTTIVADPEASACLNPSALVGLLGSQDTSIIGPINNWLTGICSSAPCSNATLATIVSNVTSGCSTELTTLGYSSGDNASITQVVQMAYPTVRKVLCLKNEPENQLCVTSLLNDVQDIYGTLSINGIIGIIAGSGADKSVPPNVTCSDCVKEAYNIVKADFPQYAGEADTETCGASFGDGQTPASIKQSANTAQPGSTASNKDNSAARALASGSAFIGILGSLAFIL